MNPILKIAVSTLTDTGSVLEIGCGGGEYINELAQLKRNLSRIVAVDLYRQPEHLNPKIEFIQADVRALTVEGRFDLIVMKHTFEHMKDPLGTIEKLKGLLNKHGKILIEVPNRRGLGNEAKIYIPEHGKHYFIWDRDSLEYSLERVGFRCRFFNLYRAGTQNAFIRYIPALLRIQNPNLICLAMLDDSGND
jgi:SAM-dependent methyltransferase